MVQDYNIEEQPHHMLWYNDGFEFPTKITKLNYIFKNEQLVNKEYNKSIDMQGKFLILDMKKMEKIDEEVNEILNKMKQQNLLKKEKRIKKKIIN